MEDFKSVKMDFSIRFRVVVMVDRDSLTAATCNSLTPPPDIPDFCKFSMAVSRFSMPTKMAEVSLRVLLDYNEI